MHVISQSQEDNEYNQLESVIYWAPSATESEIYSQMSQWKFLEIPRQIITISSKLGEGQFGEVFKASWQSTKGLIECAVKQVRKGSPSNERVKLLQEAATLGQFKHRHVIRLFGVVTVGEPVSFVFVTSTTIHICIYVHTHILHNFNVLYNSDTYV